jgi:hypothetical protein
MANYDEMYFQPAQIPDASDKFDNDSESLRYSSFFAAFFPPWYRRLLDDFFTPMAKNE